MRGGKHRPVTSSDEWPVRHRLSTSDSLRSRTCESKVHSASRHVKVIPVDTHGAYVCGFGVPFDGYFLADEQLRLHESDDMIEA